MSFPIEFTECPMCHSEVTICRLACADEPSIPKDAYVSLEKVFTPFQQPTQMLAPVMKGILCHFDVCGKCGHRYCVRAEKVSLPMTMQQASGNPIRFDPKSPRRL